MYIKMLMRFALFINKQYSVAIEYILNVIC